MEIMGALVKNPVGTFIRPANTTAYAAGDCVNNSTSAPVTMTFVGCAREKGGGGFLVSAFATSSGNETTKPQLELWLFDNAANATGALGNDNAAFPPTDAELLDVLAIIQFSTWFGGLAGTGGNSWAGGVVNPDKKLFKCEAEIMDLFGLVVVRNAYTPISAEVFTFTLDIMQL